MNQTGRETNVLREFFPIWGCLAAAAALFLVLPAMAPAQDEEEDILVSAWTALQVNNFPTAQRLFQTVIEQQPDSKRARKAEFGLLVLKQYDKGGDRNSVREEIRESLEDLYSRTDEEDLEFRMMILLQTADTYEPGIQDNPEEAAEKRQKALPVYERIMEEAKGREEAVLAAVEYSNTLMLIDPRKNLEEAIALLEKQLMEPRPETASGMLYQAIAYLYGLDEQWEKAEEFYTKWLESGIETEMLRPSVMYTIAKINEEKLNNPERALMYFERIADEFPFVKHSTEASRKADEIREELGMPPKYNNEE